MQSKQSTRFSRWPKIVRDGFALIGVTTVVAMVGMKLAPEALFSGLHARDGAKQVVVGSIIPIEQPAIPVVLAQPDPRIDAVAMYVARNYRVATTAATHLVHAAYRAAAESGLDPLVLVAVMAIESRFNPIAESEMGAKGLMQVIPKYHLEKLADHGGEASVLDPEVNIRVGARILKEYVDRSGELALGLQWYNGAANDPSRSYADKVLGEYVRLARIAGKSLPRTSRPSTASAAPAIMAG